MAYKTPVNWPGRIAWALAIVAVFLWLISGPGHAWGWWTYGTAFRTIMPWAGYIGAVAAVIALIPIVGSLWRDGRLNNLFALALGGGVMLGLVLLLANARQAPPIHDISTDLDSPPAFDTIAPRQYPDGQRFTDAQRRALQEVYYADLKPVESPLSYQETTEVAAEVLKEMGLEIADVDPAHGKVEATDTTFWFGFKDDVAIRVRPRGESGSIVDIRSVSRVGLSDIGKNAERIRDISKRLTEKLGG